MTDHEMNPRLWKIMDDASTLLTDVNQETVGIEHVMMAILDDPRAIPTQVLAQFVEPARVQRALRNLVASEEYQTGSDVP